jgi:hypothetical protein
VPARLWPVSPGFGPEALGFGLQKLRPGPSQAAPAWPGLALAQAGAFEVAVYGSRKDLRGKIVTTSEVLW